MADAARQWWRAISNQVIIALLGFLLWWAQDVLQTFRAQTEALQQEQRQYRRDIDDLLYRVRALEMRVETLRARRWMPTPPQEAPAE